MHRQLQLGSKINSDRPALVVDTDTVAVKDNEVSNRQEKERGAVIGGRGGGGSTYFPIRLSVGTRNSRFAQLLSYPPPAAGSLPLFYICLQSSPLFALSSLFLFSLDSV